MTCTETLIHLCCKEYTQRFDMKFIQNQRLTLELFGVVVLVTWVLGNVGCHICEMVYRCYGPTKLAVRTCSRN